MWIRLDLNLEILIETEKSELGIGENTVALLSIGEMIKRKNHESVLRAISKLKMRILSV